MRAATLVVRSLVWYRRTNLAVIAGVATAVAVLAGALLVGESVRASLRELFLARLGPVDHVISSTTFFRERLAQELQSESRRVAPAILLQGLLTHQTNRRRASEVEVYALDERFWKLHSLDGQPPTGRDALLSQALVAELDSTPGDSILLRVEKPSAIPRESLHGHKEDSSETIRLTFRGAASRELSIQPSQGDVRAIYVPLARLQRELEQPGRANVIFTAGAEPVTTIAAETNERITLDDLGIRLRLLTDRGALQVETASAVIPDTLADTVLEVARKQGLEPRPMLTYLANSIRAGSRETPYSLVTAIDHPAFQAPGGADNAILLSDWAARDLGVGAGDTVTLEYYVWKQEGSLLTEKADFRIAAVVPLEEGDRRMAPEYPGITGVEDLDDWDPPFPMDLSKVRRKDEDYWDRYRTTPKAFVPLARGRQLWGTRFGHITSIRLRPPTGDLRAAHARYARELRSALNPSQMGVRVEALRAEGLEASRGATDFGEYFTYFSFFLVVSALLLAGLFFKLGIEQRSREIGLLRATGFTPQAIRRVFFGEGLALALVGASIGVAASAGYAALIVLGLRTWWVEAVGTRRIELHFSAAPALAGAAGGVVMALLAIAWTLKGLHATAPRALLAGSMVSPGRNTQRRWLVLSAAIGVLGAAALLAATAKGSLPQAGGFFGAGSLLLIAALCAVRAWIEREHHRVLRHGVVRLGLRGVSYRPGRSVLSMTLIAFASFLVVSVDSFRRDPSGTGAGGYPLMAESIVPVYHDLNSVEGRQATNIAGDQFSGVTFRAFRLKPGDDASCLNLYQPRNPRVLGAPSSFLRAARFAFQASLEETTNPWLLLERPPADGAVPAIVDANSMTYVLHRKLGDVVTINEHTGRPVRLRLVAALSDSIFQREIIISEAHFIRLFPDEQGARVFLIDAPAARTSQLTTALEQAFSDQGLDIVSTAERLEAFHRVESTYLSTFRTLGLLGLLLGTVGLAAVLLRNVLERRRELALLAAVGYRRQHLRRMILAENLCLLTAGLAVGTLCALLAVAPVQIARGSEASLTSASYIAMAVLVTGAAASIAATFAALRTPLLAALHSE